MVVPRLYLQMIWRIMSGWPKIGNTIQLTVNKTIYVIEIQVEQMILPNIFDIFYSLRLD